VISREDRRREVLRQASVALQGRVVTLWEVSPRAEVLPVLASVPAPSYQATILDLDHTLHRWGTTLVQGGRWVGCWLDDVGRWCVAPVRKHPPAPPPDGVERRSRERITLELAGLCLGLSDELAGVGRRRPEPEALIELARQPSVIAHEVANPLTAALANLDLTLQRVRAATALEPEFRTAVLEDLAGVAGGMEQAIEFLRTIQDRARGAVAHAERFDAAQVARSCVVLERPLARQRGVALEGRISGGPIFLQGDPNGLYRILTNLIRNAVAASQERKRPVVVGVAQSGAELSITVQDQGSGIPAELMLRIFEPGFTTQPSGSGSGMGLAIVRQIAHEMFNGTVDVTSLPNEGSTFTVTLPIPPQRTPPSSSPS
jgi:signal transduction histidine kinase